MGLEQRAFTEGERHESAYRLLHNLPECIGIDPIRCSDVLLQHGAEEIADKLDRFAPPCPGRD
jgi:hypothetical protein